MQQEKHVQLRWMELVVAACFAAVGTVVIIDSVRVGLRWGADGPQPGYFPFYIGCVLISAAAWVCFQTLRTWKKDGGAAVFVEMPQLRLMLKMLLPTCAYVACVMLLGLYVSSALFIGAFMVWQGGYSLAKSAAVGIGVCAVLFALFEVWFLVPLPKGPLEQWLGY